MEIETFVQREDRTDVKALSRYLQAGVVLTLLAMTANAGPVTFSASDAGAGTQAALTNSAAEATTFATAVAAGSQTLNTILFGSDPLGAFTNLTVASGVVMNGSDISSSPQTIINSPLCTAALCGFAVNDSQWVSLDGGSVTFTFATPIDAFGAYLTGIQLTGESITFNDGAGQSIPIPNPGSGGGGAYVAFTDFGQGISSVTISAPGDIIGVDDVSYASQGGSPTPTSGTPEPATLSLVGFAFAGLAILGRRRQHNRG